MTTSMIIQREKSMWYLFIQLQNNKY